jgi:nitrate/nitrite-specific signal transduction histidine kinase
VGLGRRLGLALALVVLAILGINAFSLLLTQQAFLGYRQVSRESEPFYIVEDIETLFTRLALQLLRNSEAEGAAAAVEHVRQALGEHLRKFEAMHEGTAHGGPGDPHEAEILSTLWDVHAALGTVIRAVPASAGPWTRASLEEVERIATVAYEAAEKLRRSHRELHARHGEQAARKMSLLWSLYAVSVALGCSIVVLVAMLAQRRIVEPIQRVASTAMEIADGRLDARVGVRSQDEVGELSRAFNVMADRLQAREHEVMLAQRERERQIANIRALHGVGVEVARLRDLEGTLRMIVEKARELLSADAAALCLADAEEGPTFTRRAASGPAEAFPAEEPSGCERGHERCSGLAASYRVAHLTLPVGKPGKPVGYLCVGTSAVRDFAPTEVDLLAALAVQAEIVVEKAALHQEIQSLAAVQEREWLAREMHDGLAQTLGVLHLKLTQAQRAAGREPEAAGDPLEEATRLVDQAYAEVRQSLFGLRTAPTLGLVPALRRYVRDFSLQTGISVAIDVQEESLHLSPKAEVQLVRIVQEALANVRKHARTGTASLRLARQRGTVQVTVEDGGCGFDWSPRARPALQQYGLQVMRERAQSVGGTLTIESRPGEGTRVIAAIPEGL